MKILSNNLFTANNYSLNTTTKYAAIPALKPDSLSKSAVSFKGNVKFPFEHLGLKLSGLSRIDINEFVNHMDKVINYSKQEIKADKESEKAFLKDAITLKDVKIHVIKDSSNIIVGTGLFSFHNNRGKISDLYINPNWQKKGLATWIMDDFMQMSKANNSKTLMLCTENPIAAKLYGKFGFKKICNYKNEKTIVMMQGDIPKIYQIFKYLPQKIQTKLFT